MEPTMKTYKAPDQSLHCVEEQFAHLLPQGCVAISDEEAEALRAPPPMSPAETIKAYETALDMHLDSVAQEQRFKDRHSLSLRAGYPNDWQSLGASFGSWMDGCNVQAYALMEDVLAGTQELPSIEVFLSALPKFVAP